MLALALCAGTFAARAQEVPIKLGMSNHYTGTIALSVRALQAGMDLAIDDWNAKGGVLGRKVQLLIRDDQTKAALAIDHVRDLITREKVDALLGPATSGVALAVSQIADQYKKIDMITVSTSPRLTMEMFNPYVFTICPTGLMESRAWAEYLGPRYTNIAFIGPDYEASHQNIKYFGAYLEKNYPKAKVTAESYPKLGETDFTPYINKLISAKPDVVYSVLYGADLVAFINQAKSFDFFKRVKFATLVFEEDLESLGAEMPEGILAQMRAPFFFLNSPVAKGFTKRYREKTGSYPSDFAIQGYEGMDILLQGIAAAGSTDSDAIGKALLNIDYDGIRGKIRFRDVDHVGTVPSFIGVTTKTSEYPFAILKDIEVFPAEKIWPSPEEITASRK
jgi:branched-chain amino acid transport system substrate-binding protein